MTKIMNICQTGVVELNIEEFHNFRKISLPCTLLNVLGAERLITNKKLAQHKSP